MSATIQFAKWNSLTFNHFSLISLFKIHTQKTISNNTKIKQQAMANNDDRKSPKNFDHEKNTH